MTELLSTQSLSAGYHGHPVVRSLSIEVRPGEVVLLVGPNGAGKSTTLLAISGGIDALLGQVSFQGRTMTGSLHQRARDGIMLVPELRAVFRDLTVEENIRVGRCDRDQVLSLFPELTPLLKRKAGLLSGGEQQMLVLGRALARSPKLLLADELSLGLAPLVVERLLGAVRKAADATGVGALLVEQHVSEALDYADRVYVMHRGEIVLAGPVEELRTQLDTGAFAAGIPAAQTH
jgi:ABC-type branched-subunit amino acid transport system ATPase component